MARPTKSSIELAVAIMNKVREHPELNSEIKSVEIRRAERHHPGASNWEAVFEMIGYDSTGRAIPMPTPHPLANQIVRDIQSHFDLA